MKKALVAAATIPICLSATQAAAQPVVRTHITAAVRETMALRDHWRFRLGDAGQSAEQPDFNDADWEQVSVPHSWNRVGYYLPNPDAHLNRATNVNKALGTGWYRLTFSPPAGLHGKRLWLQFDAASRIASVWLNGAHLGEHKGGFSRFRFDATDSIRLGRKNTLVVKVDNSKSEPGSTTADVLPLAGDFFVHGGIYRPVNLIATDPVHIDMLDFGGPGIYAHTAALDTSKANVQLVSKIRNDSGSPVAITVVSQLVAADGHVAATDTRALALAANSAAAPEQMLAVVKPHLWQGVADPYLYRLVVEVRARDGHVLDRLDQAYGIRDMRMDPRRGFLLNGKPYALHGVGYHQDKEGKGWAISPADTEADVRMLRDMGANTIRLTHYQHGQPIHDLADRYGFIVWDEIPLVSQWTLGKAKEASPGLRSNARQQLTEEVRQNGNHASVASWGIANEVDFGNSLPAFLTGSDGTPPDPLPLLHELNGLAHELDPSRPTALATCCEGRLFQPGVEVPTTAPLADLGGANRYFGWYYGSAPDLSPALDALHAKRPAQPVAVTEYGAGGATTIHTDNVLGGRIDSRGRVQPEEVESWIHEQNWAVLAAKPYLWASWLWTSFDFASTVRQEGDAQDINTKGLVTYDRAIKKDAYYFYRANWTASPTVYVTGRRYVNRAYRVTDVRVYSNAPATDLLVNGRSLGIKQGCPLRVCVWQDVPLTTGTNDVLARGRFSGGVTEDRIRWELSKDAARTVRIDSGALVAAKSNVGVYGSDNFFVGGEPATVDKPADYGKPPVATAIAGTTERDAIATYRKGRFSYRIPLQDGHYKVALTFVEPTAGAGERLFDVLADGRPALTGMDVAKTAGGKLTAVQRSFGVQVKSGVLTLTFAPSKGDAIVSAIEISQ